MEKIKAFTMAEVLITLGIIGIVACMTMPGVIKNYQKKVTVECLKQTYSMLQQAVMLSEVKNGDIEDWITPSYTGAGDTTATETFVKMYYEPYLQTIHSEKMPTSDSPYDYYYYTNDGQKVESDGHTHYSIALINGVYLHFNANYGANKYIQLRVDINGRQKPNTIGIDIFYMYAYPEVKLVDESAVRPILLERCKTPRSVDQQASCGALIMYDGWEIRDDYPWR